MGYSFYKVIGSKARTPPVKWERPHKLHIARSASATSVQRSADSVQKTDERSAYREQRTGESVQLAGGSVQKTVFFCPLSAVRCTLVRPSRIARIARHCLVVPHCPYCPSLPGGPPSHCRTVLLPRRPAGRLRPRRPAFPALTDRAFFTSSPAAPLPSFRPPGAVPRRKAGWRAGRPCAPAPGCAPRASRRCRPPGPPRAPAR